MVHLFRLGLLILLQSLCFSADIAIVTMVVGDEYTDAVQVGLDNKQLYCNMHGYDFICFKESLDPERPIVWSKIPAVKNAFKEGQYKWIFWTDADSVIMNLGVRLEEFIDENYNLIIARDFNDINAGQFFIKNCPWSQQLLSTIYARIDCLHHPWQEQQALIFELEQNPAWLPYTKIVAQRMFNSYLMETAGHSANRAAYQIGDFIIHFAGSRPTKYVKSLMHEYKYKVTQAPEFANVDRYLQKAGFNLSVQYPQKGPRFMTTGQQKQFVARLQSYPPIKRVAEIGLYGGHRAEVIFDNCPYLEKFISFDEEKQDYSHATKEYFIQRHQARFVFVRGDPAVTVPEYAHAADHPKCDLIYIDANLADIRDCRLLADENTILWIDHDHNLSTERAILEYENKYLINIHQIHSSSDSFGERSWIEARYVFD